MMYTGIGIISFCVFLSLCSITSESTPNATEIILVQAIFRHGERTTYKFYSTDPYKNETFYPIGLGGLTNKGKLMMYELGIILREKYGKLLGDDYREEIIDVRSTNTQRTRMSALLVLAGLWQPSKKQKWHNSLLWQPIPVSYKPCNEEDLLDPVRCKLRNQILIEQLNTSVIQDKYVKPYQDIFKYVEEHSGMSIRELRDLLEFYFIIKAEDDYGLRLPEWTKSIYPEPLHNISSLVYEYMNFNATARQIHAGYLLQRLLNNSLSKIDGELLPKERSIFLYSAHETTLAHLMYTLGVFQREVPPYGSTVIFELHKLKDQYFIKIRYLRQPLHPEFIDLVIPNCGTLCPIERLIEQQSKNFPRMPYKEICQLNSVS